MRPLLFAACAVLAFAQRPVTEIRSATAEATFDVGGGSLVNFKLKGGLNPLVWIGPADRDERLRPMAHFLCLDRWGQPSPGELAAGVPYHGEATRVEWKVDAATANSTTMSARLPMAGLAVTRRASIDGAVLKVEETVTNTNKMGKIYNMVQHPTIGPPFLDEQTLVDSNARKGFMQSSPMPHPEEPSVFWPQALREGHAVDMRRLTNDPMPNVVSYVVDEPIGWATASSPTHKLVLGYIWRTSEYPWFNAWRHVDSANKPLARGLEFGTTGLHQPFGVLIEKGTIFGRKLVTYLDAGATTTRTYVAFLATTPANWQGVQNVTYKDGVITITERGTRSLEVRSGSSF
ncbi:MAG: hypothetical protein JNM66_28830 [Bryobacterales bacterium]|nr:hypothetical protein [Bryobacterales bacterium]